MTEVAATPAVETAPVATDAPATQVAPSTPSVETPSPSLSEARAGLRDLWQTKADQPRNELGQFATTTEEPTEASEAPVADAPGTTEPAEIEAGEQSGSPLDTTESTDGATAEAPEGMVVLELPEGHWARDRGLDHLTVPAEHENELRGILNDPVRRSQVTQAEAARDDAYLAAQKWEKTAEHFMNKFGEVLRNPHLVVDLHNLREQYGDEYADRQIQSMLSDEHQTVSEYFNEIDQQFNQTRAQQEAEYFTRAGSAALQRDFPFLSQGDIAHIIQSYGQAVVDGRYQELHWSTLREFADAYSQDHPARKAQQEAEQRARQEREAAEAKAKAEAEAKAQASRAANPLGRVHPGATSAPSGTGPAEAQLTVHQARSGLRDLFRTR